ncbi:Holliday junction branch migration protein RuvA [candidate division WWE3 bacterium CG10_big_fil_rev_8_21_14_0_10_32_10]|uniref:Holliday junction branch migration complex subunit RuvA n=1 Tax=candidate division WWE3 bacterium CG10_big_fil_rev_8_21_14_0_10_32_10 TaxID=1975090 RepID=A0A2H0RAU3_UNCKA|nr:MAG: Holliday junction branch migration protein RuvA [candidate division WWE3 bacterium CG10_big_fil_rev_8_21_14_0_10_32_10]
MIYSLTGTLKQRSDNFVVLDVNNIGYQIYIGSKTIQKLILENKYTFYTKLVVSDSDIFLYGFVDEGFLNMFKMLNNVSGIGPKSAFNILDAGSLQEIVSAISNADKSFFKKVSGVGPKSALKIIVELQDKVGKIKELNLKPISSADSDIIEALEGMGYHRDNIIDILDKIDSGISEQDKIKRALNLLSK